MTKRTVGYLAIGMGVGVSLTDHQRSGAPFIRLHDFSLRSSLRIIPATRRITYRPPLLVTRSWVNGRRYLIDRERGQLTNPAFIPVNPSGCWYYARSTSGAP